MAGLNIYASNDLSALLGTLQSRLVEHRKSVFTPDTIVVQSRGMERWLRLEMASHEGISANISFPFPRHFIYQCLSTAMDTRVDARFLTRENVQWFLMKALPELIEDERFWVLKKFIGDLDTSFMFFQLAERLAYSFDQYMTYRPEMIMAWEQGGQPVGIDNDESYVWQAALWRTIVKHLKLPHPARLMADILASDERQSYLHDYLTRQRKGIAIFGISTLPPFFIDVLNLVSRSIDVDCYVLSACENENSYLKTDRQIERIQRQLNLFELPKQDEAKALLHLEAGNELMVSLGRLGRDFFDALLDRSEGNVQSLHRTSETQGMLGDIQRDILCGAKPAKRHRLNANDQSIRIHNCHSMARECEVLKDQLLAQLENNPNFSPSDILVMVPNIDDYAPYIRAVFGFGAKPEMPFSIADGSAKNHSLLMEGFWRLLAVAQSRFTAQDVVALLDNDFIREHFGILPEKMPYILRWLDKANIRWGLDREALAADGVAHYNDFREGLDRLMLGFMMGGDGDDAAASCDDVMGHYPVVSRQAEEAATFSGFIRFIDQIFWLGRSSVRSQGVGAWTTMIDHLLKRFFDDSYDHQQDLQLLRQLAQDIAQQATLCEFETKIDLKTFVFALESSLGEQDHGFGFMQGGITFCALKPMRSIPFQSIALLGLNSMTFPRNDVPLGYDLIAKYPKRCDRTLRDDDRYLFLETLLSAKSNLYLSYIGQGQSDNEERPPSGVVGELLDYLARFFEGQDLLPSQDPRRVIVHDLQGFSARYYSADPSLTDLQSYAADAQVVSAALQADREPAADFMTAPLRMGGESKTVLTLHEFIRFWHHPPQYFLCECLGLARPQGHGELNSVEPFELTGLSAYKLKETIYDLSMLGRDSASIYTYLQRSGFLPSGEFSALAFSQREADVKPIVATLKGNPSLAGAGATVELDFGDIHLSGQLDNALEQSQLCIHLGTLREQKFMQAWIRHLLAQAMGGVKPTLLYGVNKGGVEQWKFGLVKDAKALLDGMMALFRQGQATALPYFAETSYAYYKSMVKNQDKSTACSDAMKKWWGSKFLENNDLADMIEQRHWANRQCFGDKPVVISDGFQDIAMGILTPLYESLEKVECVDDN